jgi:hypothetical protein
MNFKLILALSLIGLAVALGDVFFIPATISSVIWLGIYVYYAYAIARNSRAGGFGHGLVWRFLNGLALGIVNSLWITATQVLFPDRYLAAHPHMLAMVKDVGPSTLWLALCRSLHLSGSDRDILGIVGTTTGIFVGIIIGVFAVVAGMMMKPRLVELSDAPQR